MRPSRPPQKMGQGRDDRALAHFNRHYILVATLIVRHLIVAGVAGVRNPRLIIDLEVRIAIAAGIVILGFIEIQRIRLSLPGEREL